MGEAIGVKGGNGRTGKGKELGARREIYWEKQTKKPIPKR